MTSRKERTLLKSTQTEKEWGNYWFENVILKHLNPEQPTWQLLHTWGLITGNPNTTIEIVESHKHLPWDWSRICWSLIKSVDFVLNNHQSIPMDWRALSDNENISLENIEKNLHLPWDFSRISCRDGLTLEFVRRHQDKDWDILSLSKQASFWEDINKNAQNYCVLSAIDNPRITLEFIERHIDIYKRDEYSWYLYEIFTMRIATIEFIERHLDHLISTGKSECINHNPNVTVEFIIKHPEISWDMRKIIINNPNITPESVQIIYGEDKFLWDLYSKRVSFDFAHVPEDKLSDLNWNYLSNSQHVKTAEVIEKYKKYINWSILSSNPFITMEFVCYHPEFQWNCEGLLSNPNCSLEMYEKYKEESKIGLNIFRNQLVAEKEAFIECRFREHLAAYRIQQCWNRARTDPNYALCRKKLEADWAAYVLT